MDQDGPTAEQRAGSRQRVIASVLNRDGHEVVAVTLDGPNSYDYSGAMLASGARLLLAGDHQTSGVLAPVQAFGFHTLMSISEAAGMFQASSDRSPS
jgi:hypothetical protein